MVNQFLAELFGTALLILLGDGVVANIALKKTKGNGADLIVVTVGWAIAVAIPVYIFSRVSGAVFNPAVTIALGITGGLTWSQVVVFCIAQFIGAFIGSVLGYLNYYTGEFYEKDKIIFDNLWNYYLCMWLQSKF